MLNPMRKKNEVNNRRGGKDDTCGHGLYVQKLESRSAPKKKKSLLLEEMINQQSAARSTSSTKQYKHIRQLRTNTNDYSNGVRDHSNNKARHPPKSLLREKKTPNAYDDIRDECVPLTGFFRGYCRLLLQPSRGAA